MDPRQTPPRRDRANVRGVTLLELSITLAIAGVLATIAIPNLSDLQTRAAEDRDVAGVHSFLDEARSRAHIRLRPVLVTLDGGDLVATQEGVEVNREPLGDEVSALSFSTGDGTLTFTAEGGLDTDGPITLTVVTTTGRSQTLTIFPAIGAMRRNVS